MKVKTLLIFLGLVFIFLFWLFVKKSYSATLFNDNFESWTDASKGAWTSATIATGTTFYITTADKFAGTSSLKIVASTPTTNTGYLTINLTSPTTVYVRYFVKISTYYFTGVANNNAIVKTRTTNNSSNHLWNIRHYAPEQPFLTNVYNRLGQWVFDLSGGYNTPNWGTQTAWHCVEVMVSSDTASFWYDGTVVASVTGIGAGGATWDRIDFGCQDTGGFYDTLYLDEIIISDVYVGSTTIISPTTTTARRVRFKRPIVSE